MKGKGTFCITTEQNRALITQSPLCSAVSATKEIKVSQYILPPPLPSWGGDKENIISKGKIGQVDILNTLIYKSFYIMKDS